MLPAAVRLLVRLCLVPSLARENGLAGPARKKASPASRRDFRPWRFQQLFRTTGNGESGLSGEVSSGDLDRAMKLASRFRSGTVSINGGRRVDGDIPFGGYKSSGLGRAWGREGIEETRR